MAIAEYRIRGQRVDQRNFPVPKRASELKYWYRAIGKVMPSLPAFEPRFLEGADITVETIILDWKTSGISHTLIVARKRSLW